MGFKIRNFHRIVFLASLLGSSLGLAKSESVAGRTTYTLIDNLTHKYEHNLECELAVAVSSNHLELQVLRLDPRKGVYSVNYFTRSPEFFSSYGIKINLDELFQMDGAPILAIQSSFNLRDSHYDLILKATVVDPISGTETIRERTFSLENEFFKDNPKKCLK